MSLKRLFDILVTASALIVFAVPMAIIALAVKATSAGPAVYWSTRVGRDNQLFLMPKFRTMRIDTPVVATHLLTDPSKHHQLPPGLTGWAQVNGRDELAIPEKVAYDVDYMRRSSILFDLKIIAMTSVKVLGFKGVSH